MRVGILTNNFSKLNRITRKIKNTEFNLVHLKKIPRIDHEIDVIVTDEPMEYCLTPNIIPGNLDILELKIRCAYYQKKKSNDKHRSWRHLWTCSFIKQSPTIPERIQKHSDND